MRLPSESHVDAAHRSPALRGWNVVWFGHSAFLVSSHTGARLLFDPWFSGNPSCPPRVRKPQEVDLILVTHGHSDHCGDAAALARGTGAAVVSSVELAAWLEQQGVKNLRAMNIGGRQTLRGVEIAMVNAIHSSSAIDDHRVTYLGPATGFVVKCGGASTIYFAGDTALFGDMRLIADRFGPDVAFLPIGDRYTMGPEDAAIAAEMLRVKAVVPMHYGTFPELTGTVEEFRRRILPTGIDVIEFRPGDGA